MDDRQARISKLSERFTANARKPKPGTRERERRSFYLDVAVMTRLDEELKAFNHRNFPRTVSKSVFLETLLEYGLDNLDAIRARIITKTPETERTP
jgi:hypothetical protein